MSAIIPNTFQTPNLYVDKLMPLLTDTELRVILYMTRRIMGFHKERDRISLSQITDGTTSSKTGEKLDYGTGLSKQAARVAIDSLADMGIIIETQPFSREKNLPAEWALQLNENGINWDKLQERKDKTDKANQSRFKAKADKVEVKQDDTETPTLSYPIGQGPYPIAQDSPVLSDRTALSYATVPTKERGKPEENQGAATQPSLIAQDAEPATEQEGKHAVPVGKKKESSAYVHPETNVTTQMIFDAWKAALDYAEPKAVISYGKEMKAAKLIAQAGRLPDEVTTCFWEMKKKQKLYQTNHLPLTAIATNIAAVLTKGKFTQPHTNGAAQKVQSVFAKDFVESEA